MNIAFLSFSPSLQIVVALLIIVTILSAIGIDVMSTVFKFLLIAIASYAVWQHFEIALRAFKSFNAGKKEFTEFVSNIYNKEYELTLFIAGYVMVGILAVKELSERMMLPSFLKKSCNFIFRRVKIKSPS